MALRAMASGVTMSLSRWKRISRKLIDTPRIVPNTRPISAFAPETGGRLADLLGVVDELRPDLRRLGEEVGLPVEDVDGRLPQARGTRRRTAPAATPPATSAPPDRGGSPRPSDPFDPCLVEVRDLVATERFADLDDLLEEGRRPRGCRRRGGRRARRRRSGVIRPGRGDITTTRSDRYTASGIEWVTNTTLVSASAQMRSSSACMCSRVISSSAPNGSSMSSSCGPAASARAMATRCCMPPDSCHGRWSAKSPSLTSSSISRARCCRRDLSHPLSSSGSSTFLATVRHSNSPACWKAMP